MKPEILFICQGNIGRSQMAEAFYNSFTGQKRAISAGVDGVAEKYGFHPIAPIVNVMREVGVRGVEQQNIKQVNAGMMRRSQRIIVLCRRDQVPQNIQERFGYKMDFIEIPDPAFKNGSRWNKRCSRPNTSSCI